MRKVENVEQLQAEKARLNIAARQIEDGLQEDFSYFSRHLQPILSIFDRKPGKTSSLLWTGVTTIVPLLLAGRKAKSAASPLMFLGTTALSFLMGEKSQDMLSSIVSMFSKRKHKPASRKHRYHRLCRCRKE